MQKRACFPGAHYLVAGVAPPAGRAGAGPGHRVAGGGVAAGAAVAAARAPAAGRTGY